MNLETALKVSTCVFHTFFLFAAGTIATTLLPIPPWQNIQKHKSKGFLLFMFTRKTTRPASFVNPARRSQFWPAYIVVVHHQPAQGILNLSQEIFTISDKKKLLKPGHKSS